MLGLYYNRARYLNTITGRFWTADTYEGDRQSPASLHKYLYTNANPINSSDPTGHFDIGLPAMMALSAAVIALAAITVLHVFPYSDRFGLVWDSDIDWSGPLQDGGAPGEAFTSSQIQEIKQQAAASYTLAFAKYLVNVVSGVGYHTIQVDNMKYVDPKGNAGDGHTDMAGVSHTSHAHYPNLLDDAKHVVGDSDLEQLALAVGRGIGNTAAHEIGHQYALSRMHGTEVGEEFYEHNGATPAFFCANALNWTEESDTELTAKIGAKQ